MKPGLEPLRVFPQVMQQSGQFGFSGEAERGAEGPGEVRDVAEVDGEGLPAAAVRIGGAVRLGRRVCEVVHGAVSLAWLSGTGGWMRFSPVRSSLTPNILPPGVGHPRGNPSRKFRKIKSPPRAPFHPHRLLIAPQAIP